jgi:endonuclease YncB( thermonuclease family)
VADNATTLYRVIAGDLISVSDGDTANFVAQGYEWVDDLPDPGTAKPNRSGGYLRLRFQGIDTPELHYPPARSCFVEAAAKRRGVKLLDLPTILYKQPIGYAAGEALKKLTGFDDLDVHYIPAYVLTRGADGYGRLIAYILLAEDVDGLVHNTDTLVSEELLKRTLNYKMLENGMAYYTGYAGMPDEHRATFIERASASKDANIGIWEIAHDSTAPFALIDEGSLGEQGQLVLPKLFRRCMSYQWAMNLDDYRGDLAHWMERSRTCTGAEQSDMVQVGTDPTLVPFERLVECDGQTIRLTHDPFDLLFVEAPLSAFPPVPTTEPEHETLQDSIVR